MDPWIYLSAVKDAAKKLGVCYLEAVPCEFSYRTVKTHRTKNLFTSEKTTDNEIIWNEERVLKDVIVCITLFIDKPYLLTR